MHSLWTFAHKDFLHFVQNCTIVYTHTHTHTIMTIKLQLAERAKEQIKDRKWKNNEKYIHKYRGITVYEHWQTVKYPHRDDNSRSENTLAY